jgi:hypothetical protein
MAIPSNHSSREVKESKRRYYAPRGYSLCNEAVFGGGRGKSNLTSSTISRSRLSSFSTWATLGTRVYQRIDHRQCGAVGTRLNIRMYWHCTQRRLAWLVSDLHRGCYWPIGTTIIRSLCGPISTSCWKRLWNGFNLDAGPPGLDCGETVGCAARVQRLAPGADMMGARSRHAVGLISRGSRSVGCSSKQPWLPFDGRQTVIAVLDCEAGSLLRAQEGRLPEDELA